MKIGSKVRLSDQLIDDGEGWDDVTPYINSIGEVIEITDREIRWVTVNWGFGDSLTYSEDELVEL